jgi:hypothetical protein
MAFNSVVFAVFLAAILVVHWATPARYRNIILLIGSYVFYGWWDYRFLSLLLLSTVVDFSVGRRLRRTDDESRRPRGGGCGGRRCGVQRRHARALHLLPVLATDNQSRASCPTDH